MLLILKKVYSDENDQEICFKLIKYPKSFLKLTKTNQKSIKALHQTQKKGHLHYLFDASGSPISS